MQDAGDDRPSAIPEPVKKKDLSAFQMMRRERKKKIRRWDEWKAMQLEQKTFGIKFRG